MQVWNLSSNRTLLFNWASLSPLPNPLWSSLPWETTKTLMSNSKTLRRSLKKSMDRSWVQVRQSMLTMHPIATNLQATLGQEHLPFSERYSIPVYIPIQGLRSRKANLLRHWSADLQAWLTSILKVFSTKWFQDNSISRLYSKCQNFRSWFTRQMQYI